MNRTDILGVEVEPSQVGFDPARLARVDNHFKRYVEDGRLAGCLILISRGGEIVHLSVQGHRDREAQLSMQVDTIFRIYSMTKPITSVAAMMLYEEGAFDLRTPVSRFIPSFEQARVYQRGPSNRAMTAAIREPVQIWHLLTHTAGLSYGGHHAHAVDELYRAAGYEWDQPPGKDLAAACDTWARLPLLFEPGAAWHYSHATDVLGRVIEVASGQLLDEFLTQRIFEPLGMTDTAFWVREQDRERLAALYTLAPGGSTPYRDDVRGASALQRPEMLLGGAGLVSTAHDYHRFAQMLLRGGELEGARLLSPRTVEYMTNNHLPGGADLETAGPALLSETTPAGTGFGLGFAVVLDPVATRSLGNKGEYSWGGAASTTFWVDPVDDVVVIFMTQLSPSSSYPIHSELRQLVYQALVA